MPLTLHPRDDDLLDLEPSVSDQSFTLMDKVQNNVEKHWFYNTIWLVLWRRGRDFSSSVGHSENS